MTAAQQQQAAADAKKKQEQQQQQQQTQQEEQTAQQAKAQAVTAAQKTANDAQSALDAITVKAETEFDASPEYVAANSELKAAQGAYEAAASVVTDKIDTTPAFVAAKGQRDSVEKELDTLKADSSASPDAVLAKSQELMTVSSAAHKLETDAVEADPVATAAHEKLLAAQKAASTLRAAFHAKFIKTSEYLAAKSAVDEADKQLVDAQRGHPSHEAPAVETVKGKIIGVAGESFTMSVVGAKNVKRTVTVKFSSDSAISGPASGKIDKSAVGETASVVGKESGNTINATSITVSGTPKKPAAA